MRKETYSLGMESCQIRFLSSEMIEKREFLHRGKVGNFGGVI